MYFSIKVNILHLYSNSKKKKKQEKEKKENLSVCSLHDLRNKNINVEKKYAEYEIMFCIISEI